MYNYIFKICVFGDYNTGKTSFLNCLQDMDYVRTYEPTIGVEYSAKIMELSDDKLVKVTFWDCAGQERFHSVTNNFFKDVTAGLLFFDVTDKQSYEKWLNEQEIFSELVAKQKKLENNNKIVKKINLNLN